MKVRIEVPDDSVLTPHQWECVIKDAIASIQGNTVGIEVLADYEEGADACSFAGDDRG